MKNVITETNLSGVRFLKRGKVRDIYDFGENLLIISTDRISAFDCVLPEGIPLKGKILNQLSAFWFKKTNHIIPNHMITINIEDFPSDLSPFKKILKGRAMFVKKSSPISFECVVRGYLSGSAYREYKKNGQVAKISLPQGLKKNDPLPYPIFTPAIKSREGHDINISFDEMERMIGKELALFLKETSLKIYNFAASFLDSRGFILADTKFEFGRLNDEIIIIDELLTPDSSRFWLKEDYIPGKDQESFDKQFVRDYLEKLNWNKLPPPPSLPPDIVQKTSEIYQKAFQKITGKSIFDT